MKQKSTRFWMAILAISLTISMAYMLLNPTTERQPTAAEREDAAQYVLDWRAIPGWEEGMTEKEFILNLCSYSARETIDGTVHTQYTSDVLPVYLYRCYEITEIVEREGYLYISYLAEDEDQIILVYTDAGIHEVGIYDTKTDTFFHELDGSAVVWNKFRKGFRWGK